MYEPTRNLLLRWLKVPPEPHAPFGDPASLRVFRAGRNYFKLRLLGWAIPEVIALAGIIFWAVVLIQVEDELRTRRKARAAQSTPAPVATEPVAPAEPSASPPAAPAESKPKNAVDWKYVLGEKIRAATDEGTAGQPGKRKRLRITSWTAFKRILVEFAGLLPDWAFPVVWLLKIVGIVIYLVQIPITYTLRRLDYEMRWYIVTDRSLRIRTGVWNVQELTMSFANLQQVVVTQGPVQRLLGLADVRVQSAGGGGAEPSHDARQQSLHVGHFHGVEHASEIRDLILERLKRFRESGLGDPEEARRIQSPAPVAGTGLLAPVTGANPGLLAAARELRDEARALRVALG